MGIAVEFTSHGISGLLDPSKLKDPHTNYDTISYPISVARQKMTKHPHFFNKPLTVAGFSICAYYFRGRIDLFALAIHQTTCLFELLCALH